MFADITELAVRVRQLDESYEVHGIVTHAIAIRQRADGVVVVEANRSGFVHIAASALRLAESKASGAHYCIDEVGLADVAETPFVLVFKTNEEAGGQRPGVAPEGAREPSLEIHRLAAAARDLHERLGSRQADLSSAVDVRNGATGELVLEGDRAGLVGLASLLLSMSERQKMGEEHSLGVPGPHGEPAVVHFVFQFAEWEQS